MPTRTLPNALLVAAVALAVWALIFLIGLLVAPEAEAGSLWAGSLWC